MNSIENSISAKGISSALTLNGLEVTFDEFYSEMTKDFPKTEPVEINYAKSIYMIAGVVVFFALTSRVKKYYSISSDFIKELIKQGELKNPDFKNNVLECMNFVEPARINKEDSDKSWLDDYRIVLGNWIFKKYYSRDSMCPEDKKHSMFLGEKTVGQVFGFWISQNSKILSPFINQYEKDFLSNLYTQLKVK